MKQHEMLMLSYIRQQKAYVTEGAARQRRCRECSQENYRASATAVVTASSTRALKPHREQRVAPTLELHARERVSRGAADGFARLEG